MAEAERWRERLLAWLRYTILSEEEYSQLELDDQARTFKDHEAKYNLERQLIMPWLTRMMSLFAI